MSLPVVLMFGWRIRPAATSLEPKLAVTSSHSGSKYGEQQEETHFNPEEAANAQDLRIVWGNARPTPSDEGYGRWNRQKPDNHEHVAILLPQCLLLGKDWRTFGGKNRPSKTYRKDESSQHAVP
jgi:hypothetical protein